MERDLEKDLKICEAATPEPWGIVRKTIWLSEDSKPTSMKITEIGPICANAGADDSEVLVEAWLDVSDDDALFVAEAREGWPHAIRRSLEAEKKVEELQQALKGAAEITNIASGHLNELRNENERLKKLLLHIEKKLGSQYSEILSDF